MRVAVTSWGNQVKYEFSPEWEDSTRITRPDGSVYYSLARRTCKFKMPERWRLADCHPDLLGLVALAIGSAFRAREIKLSFGISQVFQEAAKGLFGTRVRPCDPLLAPRKMPAEGRPALSFSAGVDSAVALMLMPRDTVSVYQERVDHEGERVGTMMDKSAALRACRILGQSGRKAIAIQTDMEHLRKPVGFFNDLAMAAPVFLLADWAQLDSLGYGFVMESAYLNQGHRYRNYLESGHWVSYGGITRTVGLPLHLVTAGLSEVLTSRLFAASPMVFLGQSCIRGPFARPCGTCYKCFRKAFLLAANLGEELPERTVRAFFRAKDVSRELAKDPIKHQNVISFIAQKYKGEDPHLAGLRKRFARDSEELDWMTRWFPGAQEALAERYREESTSRILALVEPMDDADQGRVKSWDCLGQR